MGNKIYQLAIECKSFSDEYVKYFQQMVANRSLFFVVGANKSFEGLLLSLCDTISEKYPYIATKIKEHTLQYDRMPVIHQSAIVVTMILSSILKNAVMIILMKVINA